MSTSNNPLLQQAAEKSLPRPAPATDNAPSAKFIPQLDGVRGLAILAVMAVHLLENVPRFSQSLAYRWFFLGGALGGLGVDLFFVLSGFLITGILIDSSRNPKFFRNFYARRALRIWPLYYSVVFFAFLFVPHFRPDLAAKAGGSHPLAAHIFFLQNFLVSPADYAFLGITWSVAIEEQFYMFWPLLVRYCKTSTFTIVLLAILCLEPVLRFWLLRLGMDPFPTMFRNVFCRLDGLAAGSLLAIYARSSGFNLARLLRFCRLAVLLGILGYAVTFDSPSLKYSFLALGFVGFIAAAIYSPTIGLRKFLMFRPLLYTGQISYGLYLLNEIAFTVTKNIFYRFLPYSPMTNFAYIFTGTAAVYLMATISWHVLERPALSLKKHFEKPPRPSLAHQDAAA